MYRPIIHKYISIHHYSSTSYPVPVLWLTAAVSVDHHLHIPPRSFALRASPLRENGFGWRMVDEEMERQELARQNRVSKPVTFLRSSLRVVSLPYSSGIILHTDTYIYARTHILTCMSLSLSPHRARCLTYVGLYQDSS